MRTRGYLIIFATFLLLAAAALSVVPLFNAWSCSGYWQDCQNALADDANRAVASVNSKENRTGTWNNYCIRLKKSAVINSVVAQADFYSSKKDGYISIRASSDNGTTFGPEHVVGGNKDEQSFIIDLTNDSQWDPDKLNDSHFRIDVTCFKKGGLLSPTCYLDWLPVNVSYTPFDFSVAAEPSSTSPSPGKNIESKITVNLASGNPKNVTLSQKGCPSPATCTFAKTSGIPAYSTAFTVSMPSSTAAGVYLINISGFGDDLTRDVIFTLNVSDSQPKASSSASNLSGISPLTVNFTGSVSGGDSPFAYSWNFDDGSTSSLQNPQHTFSTSGVYDVSFTATDFDGDKSASYLVVNVLPGFDFSISLSSGSETVSSGNAATIVTVKLDSGASKKVTLSYTNCPTDATCSFNQSSGNPAFDSNFSVSSLDTPGTFDVNITATGDGKTRSKLFRVKLSDSQPTASAGASPTSGAAPLTVTFNGTSTSGDAPITFLWNFNDSTTSTQKDILHTYSSAGTYNASFKATDTDGDSSISYAIITVS